MIKKFVLLLFMALAMFSCENPVDPNPEPVGNKVKIFVTDSSTGLNINGAEVFRAVLPIGTPSEYGVSESVGFTDSNGELSVLTSKLPTDTYCAFQVGYPGYQVSDYKGGGSWDLTYGIDTSIECIYFQIQPMKAGVTTNYRGILSASMTYNTDNKIGGATVKVDNQTVISDLDGEFNISVDHDGVFTIEISHPYYKTLSYDQYINSELYARGFDLVLWDGYYRPYIAITAVDSISGTPINGYNNIRLTLTGSLETVTDSPQSTSTPIVGRFHHNGSFELKVEADGYETITETLTEQTELIKEYRMVKSAVSTYTTTVSGIVSNSSDSSAVAGATVSIGGDSTVTDSSGSYSLQITHTGDFTIDVSATGYIADSLTFTNITASTQNADFALNANSGSVYNTTLSGQVTDATTGLGIANAGVSANLNNTFTDSNGYYSIQLSHNGSISFAVSAVGYEGFIDPSLSVTSSSFSKNISLSETSGQHTTTVSGYVRDSLGQGIAGAIVLLNTTQVTTGSNGYYSKTIDHDGNIAIAVNALGYIPQSFPAATTAGTYSKSFTMISM